MTDTASSSDSSSPLVRIIDDDVSVGAALADLLASIGIATRTFTSTRAFLDEGSIAAAGCIILDVRMPGQGGLDFQREMTRLGIGLPVIFVTAHGDVATAVQAMKAGAADFFLKPFDNQALIDAVNAAIRRDAAAGELRMRREALTRRLATLTAGERAVFAGVADGMPNKDIARVLGVSEITVKVRRGRAMRKLGAGSLPELVRLHAELIAAGCAITEA